MKKTLTHLALCVAAWAVLASVFTYQKWISAPQAESASGPASLSAAVIDAGNGVAFSTSPTGSSNGFTCLNLSQSLTFQQSNDSNSGAEVTELQRFLIQAGYFSATPNGNFGPATFAAVKLFQQEAGLPMSGFVGPLTRQKIQLASCTSAGLQGNGGHSFPSSTSSSAPVISSLWPSVGAVGTEVVIRGTGFTATGNKVVFGNSKDSSLQSIASTDGLNVSFAVPSDVVNSGTYPVTLFNTNGQSNTSFFYIPPTQYSNQQSSNTGNNNAYPTISYLSAASGPIGTSVTVYGSNFSSDSVVVFGGGVIGNPSIDYSGTLLSFTIPSAVGALCSNQYNGYCPASGQSILPGTYNISIQNQGGTSNSLAFLVTSAQATNVAPTITSVLPNSGKPGDSIAFTGTGFDSQSTLTVTDPATGTLLASTPTGSTDGSTFTVPVPGLTAGQYNLSVSNEYGASNLAAFTILGGTTVSATAPTISNLSVTSGPAGTWVTVTGTNFTSTGNTVSFGPGATVGNLTSSDGVTLSFSVPAIYDTPTCPTTATCIPTPIPGGNQSVFITNANGTTNSAVFVLTTAAAPTLPPAGPTGSFSASCSAADSATGAVGTSFKTGESVTFTAVTNPPSSSGSTAYTYAWTAAGKPGSIPSSTITYTTAGKKAVKVKITDSSLAAKYRSVIATCPVTITK